MLPIPCVWHHHFPCFRIQFMVWMPDGIWPEKYGRLEQTLGMWMIFVLFSFHQQERGLRINRDFLCTQLKAVIRRTWCSEVSHDRSIASDTWWTLKLEIISCIVFFPKLLVKGDVVRFFFSMRSIRSYSDHTERAVLPCNSSEYFSSWGYRNKSVIFITEGKTLSQQHCLA